MTFKVSSWQSYAKIFYWLHIHFLEVKDETQLCFEVKKETQVCCDKREPLQHLKPDESLRHTRLYSKNGVMVRPEPELCIYCVNKSVTLTHMRMSLHC